MLRCSICNTKAGVAPARTLDGTPLGYLCPVDASRGRDVIMAYPQGQIVIRTVGAESLTAECDRLMREWKRMEKPQPMSEEKKAYLNSPEQKLLSKQRRKARREQERMLIHEQTLKCKAMRRKEA